MTDQKPELPYVGSYVLESLTTGMYGASENALREYIQNAFDSVRTATQLKMIDVATGRIDVLLVGKDQISVTDNGVGVAAGAVWTTLTSIGASKKDRHKQAGFRGIGRLAGIAFCDKLAFRTKAAEEAIESTVTFDCKKLRKGMNDGGSKLVDLLAASVTLTTEESSEVSRHYMEVTLKGLSEAPDVFTDLELLRKYLEEISPVEFAPTWESAKEILSSAKAQKWTIETANIFVGTSPSTMKPVYKPYQASYPLPRGKSQDITEIRFFPGGESQWWAWVGLPNMTGIIPDKRVRGIRVRVKNIEIDGMTIFDELFTNVEKSFARFNAYYVGEVHVVPSLLVPNARRDGFEDNAIWRRVKHEIERVMCEPLARRAYELSNARQKSLEKIEEDVKKLVAATEKFGRNPKDPDTRIKLLNSGANLRAKISSALEDALPDTQLRLKTQLQMINTAQKGLTKELESSECKKVVDQAVEQILTLLQTYLGPEEFRKLSKMIRETVR
jgi:hypothetical protein